MTLGIAFRAIFANRLRSLLTMLGVMIGIAAVIALQAIGEGQKQAQLEIFEMMGANKVMVFPGYSRGGNAMVSSNLLTLEDADAIGQLPRVSHISPNGYAQGHVKYLNNFTDTQITGAVPEYFSVENFSLQGGHFFDATDVINWSRVAVLGAGVAKTLFADRDPVGESLKINGKPFEIVGVMAEKGALPWYNPDDQVVVPITTLWNKLGSDSQVEQIVVQARTSQDSKALEEDIKGILQQRHPQFLRNEDLYSIFNAAEMQQQREDSARVISLFLRVVGAVALFIGGIGIMNIMLVTVSERTREIGLRKAIGATPTAIIFQFLLEALLLCVMAGGLGIAAGTGITVWLASKADVMEFPAPVLQTEAIWLAAAVSCSIAIVFGTTPAIKASQMDPIRCLRHE